ncbi:MAG: hypothetical protein K1060chlam1_00093 [Candidatus Anoxychlamydiales bacterium]|nr:hypothetical protein [Candidatus Anoxychlamydiales bacterium]
MLRLLFTINLMLFSINAMAENNNNQIQQRFKTFTAKITGSKVRLRSGADLDSHIITQLSKNELVLVKEDAGDFWGIKPLSNAKAYVFRSYVIDNVVEADRVNIRLEPNLDSSIIGQLKNKDKIEAKICSENNKWLEIAMPDDVYFYVAKEYLTYAGDSSFYTKMQSRKSEVEKILNSAYFITQTELKKPYDEMQPHEAIDSFDLIIKEYSEFPQHVQQAKEGLALLQDNYLQKKIAYLEAKANISHMEKDELLKAVEKANTYDEELQVANQNSNKNITGKMKFWGTVEDALYATWTTFHPEKRLNDFYKEQEINAVAIAGVIESFSQGVKNKPGDYIVKLQDPTKKAFLYSTKVNLDDFVGKKVNLKVSPRPNNNFAYPAYFVNQIEVQ